MAATDTQGSEQNSAYRPTPPASVRDSPVTAAGAIITRCAACGGMPDKIEDAALAPRATVLNATAPATGIRPPGCQGSHQA